MNDRTRNGALTVFVMGCLALVYLGSQASCSLDDPEVTIGRSFPMERCVAIKRGGSTKRQVEELMGKPFRVEKLDGRKERWKYYSREEVIERILYVIPNQTRVKEQELILIFDGTFVESFEKHSTDYLD